MGHDPSFLSLFFVFKTIFCLITGWGGLHMLKDKDRPGFAPELILSMLFGP